MSTIKVSRSNVTAEEVSVVLREGLGSRYRVTPFVTSHVHQEFTDRADSILVKRHWFEQANVKIVARTGGTEIHVSGAGNFTLPGVLFNRASIVRKVGRVLEGSTVLAES
jgi:hypothetical protein